MGSLEDCAATPPRTPVRTPLKSFARRARPIKGFGKMKWEHIRRAFNEFVRPYTKKPSTQEAGSFPFFTRCEYIHVHGLRKKSCI